MSSVNKMLRQSRSHDGKIMIRSYPKDPWKLEIVQEFIDSWKLTDEQVEKLWKLQRKLVDLDHWKNEPETVLRFMFAPTGYDAAEKCLRDMVQWRLDNNVDTILQDYTPPKKLLDNAAAAMLHGFDRDGDPIYVERGGATMPGDLLKEFGQEELIKYAIWTRELHTRGAWIERFERLQSRRIRYVTVVYDLKGLCTAHMNRKVLDLFGEIMNISQTQYPGPFKRIIIIRAPSIFRYIWAVAKHFFRQSARDKMVFANKNYLDVLDTYIDRSVLPPSIAPGGRGKVAMGMPPLIGDVDLEKDHSTNGRFQKRKIALDASYGSFPGAASIGDSDDGSASSDEFSNLDVSVSGSALLKGHWRESRTGSEVFTSPFA